MNNGNDNQSIYAVRMLFSPNIYAYTKANANLTVRFDFICMPLLLISTMSPVPQIITHSTVAVMQSMHFSVYLCHCLFPFHPFMQCASSSNISSVCVACLSPQPEMEHKTILICDSMCVCANVVECIGVERSAMYRCCYTI